MELVSATLLPRQHPRLTIIDVLVGFVGQRHNFTNGAAEFPRFITFGHRLAIAREALVKCWVIQSGAEARVERFLNKARAAAGNIDQFANQVGIHPLNKVFQVQVNVFDSVVQFGSKVVTQIVRIEVVQVGAGSNECAA